MAATVYETDNCIDAARYRTRAEIILFMSEKKPYLV